MARPAPAILAFALLLVLAPVAASSVPGLPTAGATAAVPTAAYVSHSPILIDGDAGFTAANGVTAGNGTAADPFVIEGWDINGSSQGYPSPLQVQATRAYFTVRNVSVHDYQGYDIFSGGIELLNVSNARIEDVSVSNSSIGIGLVGVTDLLLMNSTIGTGYSTGDSVYAAGVVNSTFEGNVFGIGRWSLASSHDVVVRNNSFGNDLEISGSLRISVLANGEIPRGLFLSGATADEYASHIITPDNLVNGLPIRYYANCAGIGIDGVSAGSVLVANCSTIRVANVRITGAPFMSFTAISLAFVHGAYVADNVVNLTGTAIRVVSSSDVTIERNSIANTLGRSIDVEGTPLAVIEDNELVAFKDVGISLWSSPNASVLGNNLTRLPTYYLPIYVLASGGGIQAVDSSGTVFYENHLADFWSGITAGYSDRMEFRGNVFDGGVIGIDLYSASNATLAANQFENVGLRIQGAGGQRLSPWDLNLTVTEDNLVNGRPLRYYHGCEGLDLDGTDAGQVIVADCTDVQIQRLNISLGVLAITLLQSDRATIANNWVSGNATEFSSGSIEGGGIMVDSSSNVTVASNHVTNGIASFLNSFVTIVGNDVSGTPGIWIYGGNNTTITSNVVRANPRGINLMYASNSSVTANEIVGNTVGIYVLEDRDIRIFHNNIKNNTQGATQIGSSNITWDDGYPSGGNYWSDYSGTDRCSGVNQTTCGAGDGIGDTPYVNGSTGGQTITDRYPLMAPYVVLQTEPGLSPYVVIGAGAAIVGAVAAGVYLVWRFRRRPVAPSDPRPESKADPPNTP